MTVKSISKSGKIIYLTAGAAGMYCGSCLHDNSLARALIAEGWNVQLVPTYTPIRTDEQDVSVDQVLFGGLNVYLQQRVPFLRYLPMFVDRFLDSPKLIRRVTAKAIDTDAATLGSLALSMLKGVDGNQRKEVSRMTKWLVKERPDLLIFTNFLICGCLPHIKQKLDIPVLVTLQGDDIFLNGLKPPFMEKCMQQIHALVPYVDGFIVHSEFYRSAMSRYFQIDPRKIFVTPLGIDVDDFKPSIRQKSNPTPVGQVPPISACSSPSETPNRKIGYLARLAPEKGLHKLVEAFIALKQRAGFEDVTLQIAGWMGPPNLNFAKSQWMQLEGAGLGSSYRYWGAVDRKEKLQFLSEIDLLCVPTEMEEPKGLYALEAMAAGVPCVLPEKGAFPELIRESEGGFLYPDGNPETLVDTLAEVLNDLASRNKKGILGQQYVHQHRNAKSMADSTSQLINKILGQ